MPVALFCYLSFKLYLTGYLNGEILPPGGTVQKTGLVAVRVNIGVS